jgi:hypothetical protein
MRRRSLGLCKPGQLGQGRPHSLAAQPAAAAVAGLMVRHVQAESARAHSLPASLYAIPVSARLQPRYMHTAQVSGDHLCVADIARPASTSIEACHQRQAHVSYEEVRNVSMPGLHGQVQRCVAAVVCCSVEQRALAVLDRRAGEHGLQWQERRGRLNALHLVMFD